MAVITDRGALPLKVVHPVRQAVPAVQSRQKLISELTVIVAEVFRPLDVDELELSPSGKT